MLSCVADATCDDVELLLCAEEPSLSLQVCFEACQQPDFVCADQSDTIPAEWVCDCEADCEDASDEAGCPPKACFDCRDGSGQLDDDWVCDCYEDCTF